MKIPMDKKWKEELEEELNKPYFLLLMEFIESEYRIARVFPPQNLIFESLNRTPFENVKVVILGQDPYHNAGQSHGLAFSVPKNVKIPPSLRNIYKSLKNDYEEFIIPGHGNLSFWAEQGVLLLNTTLTVREKSPGSHQKRGWETFTDRIIQLLSEKKEGVVFLLWGTPAHQKLRHINLEKHYVLKTVHPSPLSAHRGFLNCKHFSKTNTYLLETNRTPINWQIKP